MAENQRSRKWGHSQPLAVLTPAGPLPAPSKDPLCRDGVCTIHLPLESQWTSTLLPCWGE